MFRIEGVEYEKSEEEEPVEIEEEAMSMSMAGGHREPRRVIATESVNQSNHSSGEVNINSQNQSKPETPKTSGKNKSNNASNNFKFSAESFFTFKQTKVTLDYTIGKKLGEGSYGEVRLVIHKNSGLSRAMKSIKKENLPKEEQTSLINEVNLLKSTDHANILKIFDLYEDKRNYYIITEYCSGGELYDRIKKLHTFTEKQAALLMKQILSSVNYLHSNGIVHRDLKAENILFESTDSNSGIKIIDFGISRKILKGQMLSERIGTPFYIAPEVLTKSYNEKCDIWSCGVILYILLCGYPPFNGADDKKIFKAISAGNVKFYRTFFIKPAEDWDDISTEAKNLIRRMLTVDPLKRISASEALNHDWIVSKHKSVPLSASVMKNLESFQVTCASE